MNTTAIVGTTQKVHYQVPAHLPSKISEKAEVLPVVSQACCSFVLLSAGRESMLTATGLHLQVVNCTAPAHLPSKDLREGPSAACGQLCDGCTSNAPQSTPQPTCALHKMYTI
jgi:hypothetical protein